MKNLLFSLCCCIALGNLCRAQEFPHSYEMYDIHFNLEGTKISRDYVLHETVNFIAPNYETIQSLYCNDYEQGDPFLVCGNVVFTLLVDEMIYHLLPGENIELQLTPGNHVLNAGIEFVEENCPDNTLNE